MNGHSLSGTVGRSLLAFGLMVSSIVACRSTPAEDPRASPAALEASRAKCSANEGEQQCVTCCAGTGPVRPLVQQAEHCMAACGQDDKACYERCYEAFDTACEPLGKACETFWACAESCYGSCASEDRDGGKDDEENKGARRLLKGGDKPPKGECCTNNTGGGDDDNDDDKAENEKPPKGECCTTNKSKTRRETGTCCGGEAKGGNKPPNAGCCEKGGNEPPGNQCSGDDDDDDNGNEK